MPKSSRLLKRSVMQALLMLCIAAMSPLARAQAGTAEPWATPAEKQQFIEQARERLKLTPEQEPKVKALVRTEAEKLKAIDAKYGGNASREARINRAREMKASREDFRGSLSQVLTPEQMKEWDALRDEAMAKARARRSGE